MADLSDHAGGESSAASDAPGKLPPWFKYAGLGLFLFHASLMLIQYGRLPIAPVLGDEVIVNDTPASLAAGNGYVAASFSGSQYGIDHLFAHFPPVYPLAESVVFRALGFSVYSLRLTTTIMSIAEVGVLIAFLGWLCKRSLLHPTTALACAALYSVCAPLIIRERMARMESMVGVLALLCMWALMKGSTQLEQETKWLFASATFAGLCLAVHPEALSLLPLFLPVGAIALRSRISTKLAGLSWVFVVPGLIWTLTYRSKSIEALNEMRSITKIAPRRQPNLTQWLHDLAHLHTLAGANVNLLMLLILALLVGILVSFFIFRTKDLRPEFWNLTRSFAVGAALTLLFVQCGLGYNSTRYQFLIGPLMIQLAIAAKGSAPLSGTQTGCAFVFTLLECCVLVAYLDVRPNRARNLDPNRYLPIIAKLPKTASCKLLATPSLWVDLRTAKKPFTVLYQDGGFDGERQWIETNRENPLARFDLILLDEADYETPLVERWASLGRRSDSYAVGGDIIRIYYNAACEPGGR